MHRVLNQCGLVILWSKVPVARLELVRTGDFEERVTCCELSRLINTITSDLISHAEVGCSSMHHVMKNFKRRPKQGFGRDQNCVLVVSFPPPVAPGVWYQVRPVGGCTSARVLFRTS